MSIILIGMFLQCFYATDVRKILDFNQIIPLQLYASCIEINRPNPCVRVPRTIHIINLRIVLTFSRQLRRFVTSKIQLNNYLLGQFSWTRAIFSRSRRRVMPIEFSAINCRIFEPNRWRKFSFVNWNDPIASRIRLVDTVAVYSPVAEFETISAAAGWDAGHTGVVKVAGYTTLDGTLPTWTSY